VAGPAAEPFVAGALCACLLALLAFDLQNSSLSRSGHPTALVILVALAAGWTLSARWAAPVWVLCAAVCGAVVVAGTVLALNGIAITAAALGAAAGGHAGSTAYRRSLRLVDRQISLIRRAAAVVSGPSNLPAMLEEVLRATVELLGGPADGRDPGAAVLALEGGRAKLVSAVGRDPAPDLKLSDPADRAGAALLAEALRGQDPAVTDGSGRFGLARVEAAGGPWGVLVAGRPAGARFSERDLVLLRAIADLAGVAVDSAARAGDLDRLRERLQGTLDLAAEVGSSLDPADVTRGVLRRACEALDADRAMLARVRGEEAELVAAQERHGGEGTRGPGGCFPTARLRAQPVLRLAMERLTPAAGGPPVAAEIPERYLAEIGDIRTVLAAPLVGNGELVGVLALGRRREAPFTADDLATAGQFGSISVLALMNSWAHAELERGRRSVDETARQLRVAVEAAKDVGFEIELDKVTRRLLVRAAEAVGADRGSIGRIDGDQVIVEADWPESGASRPGARTMSLAGVSGLLDRLRAGEPIQQTTAAAGDSPARHWLQCPLLAGGELVGVMNLSRGGDEPFGEADLHGLQQLTSLTALNLRSARLLAQARGLGQAKSEFLNMAAHELRTPLAVVRGYLSMMADGTLEVPEKTRNNVVVLLCQKTDELSAMVEQILTAAQIQAGGVQLQRHVFDLRDVLTAAVERARPRAEQVGIELWCQPLPDAVPVEAVRVSVGRILDNLIGNAVTYGNLLPVRVSVETDEEVLVRVEDQGLGISPEQQERLFEPFFRVDQPAVQGLAGTGLGLAVSRRLAELSGGSLELEWTQPGSGSSFVLRLPAASAELSQ
jgi:signal transduction histidine kinase